MSRADQIALADDADHRSRLIDHRHAADAGADKLQRRFPQAGLGVHGDNIRVIRSAAVMAELSSMLPSLE